MKKVTWTERVAAGATLNALVFATLFAGTYLRLQAVREVQAETTRRYVSTYVAKTRWENVANEAYKGHESSAKLSEEIGKFNEELVAENKELSQQVVRLIDLVQKQRRMCGA